MDITNLIVSNSPQALPQQVLDNQNKDTTITLLNLSELMDFAEILNIKLDDETGNALQDNGQEFPLVNIELVEIEDKNPSVEIKLTASSEDEQDHISGLIANPVLNMPSEVKTTLRIHDQPETLNQIKPLLYDVGVINEDKSINKNDQTLFELEATRTPINNDESIQEIVQHEGSSEPIIGQEHKFEYDRAINLNQKQPDLKPVLSYELNIQPPTKRDFESFELVETKAEFPAVIHHTQELDLPPQSIEKAKPHADAPQDNLLIYKQIQDKLQIMIHRQHQTATIQLEPEELGKIEINVLQKDNHTHLSFNTSLDSTKQIIESRMDTLKSLMQANGLQLGDVNISSNSNFSQSQGNPNRALQHVVMQTDSVTTETLGPIRQSSGSLDLYA